MQLRIVGDQGDRVLRLTGEVDMLAAEELRKAGDLAVAEVAEGSRMVIDLREVTFLDSSGLGALVAIRNKAMSRDLGCALRSVPDKVMKVLLIAGLHDVFSIEP
ncbi:MAG: STAS domain-containing protein [Actinomycetota bacterium]|nr:STAS domain-containing protein [Actinomycetota bacterium]